MDRRACLSSCSECYVDRLGFVGWKVNANILRITGRKYEPFHKRAILYTNSFSITVSAYPCSVRLCPGSYSTMTGFIAQSRSMPIAISLTVIMHIAITMQRHSCEVMKAMNIKIAVPTVYETSYARSSLS
jgi:hypothetical protein